MSFAARTQWCAGSLTLWQEDRATPRPPCSCETAANRGRCGFHGRRCCVAGRGSRPRGCSSSRSTAVVARPCVTPRALHSASIFAALTTSPKRPTRHWHSSQAAWTLFLRRGPLANPWRRDRRSALRAPQGADDASLGSGDSAFSLAGCHRGEERHRAHECRIFGHFSNLVRRLGLRRLPVTDGRRSCEPVMLSFRQWERPRRPSAPA